MPLFQRSVLAKHLKLQDQTQVDKAYKKYAKYFLNTTIQKNIRESKEEQFQATFLNELFVNVFGYTLNPQPKYNLTTELKNEKNSRKVDGAILKDGAALAVIELKGTNTKDLEKVRQQAFDYKANQSGCVYVITSNFEKLRFYINNAVDFEEFDLFSLNESNFALFYLCLAHENLINNIPLTIKEASIHEEEQITKKFYADYSQFKRELFRDLVKRNMKNEAFRTELSLEDTERGQKNIKHKLFKKSQKLIDRFLFIFFAEDRDLLPPNSTVKILDNWDKLNDLDAIVPLYDRFKLYFNYLDTGRKGTSSKAEIFAYNGGLFKPDATLDSLLISDDLLYKHAKTLSHYDFESQVDVNILGHIFENSLNEIESVNAEIEGTDFDKQTTKRKKDGVFYTPKYITKYIVDNTVGKLCEEKKAELKMVDEDYHANQRKDVKRRLLDALETYRAWLLQLTICDPACGSGAFLNQALDFLINEHEKVDELQTALLGGGFVFPEIENTVLENNIFGVDLNEESVEIAKLSLWLRTAQPRRKLNDLNSNIQCGNSLIESKSVAGDKAFKWEEAFPKVFEKGGFDVVIGNPPYVRQELLGTTKAAYIKAFPSVGNGTADLYIYFYELGMNILKDNGVLSYITPNKWFKTKYGKELRNFMKRFQIVEIVDFFELKIFEDASTEPQILIVNKCSSTNPFIYKPVKRTTDFVDGLISGIKLENEDLNENEWVFLVGSEKEVLDKLYRNSVSLKEYTNDGIKLGIKTALNKAFIIDRETKNEIVKFDPKSSELIEEYANATDIKAWHLTNEGETYFINTGYDITISENSYSGIWRHLNQFYAELEKRQDKGKTPYNLRACVYYNMFYEEKIIFIHTAVNHHFYLDSGGVFVNNNSYIIGNASTLLCAILNSSVFNYLKTHIFAAFGDASARGRSRLNHEKMSRIPIPKNINSDIINLFERNVRSQMGSSKEFYSKGTKFTTYLQSKFSIEKLTRKLESWHELTFAEFIKELNKAIKTVNKERASSEEQLSPIPELTKLDEMDWMEVFETKKAEAQALKAEIDKTDKEIDQMVYALYGLTEEEIAIVEGA